MMPFLVNMILVLPHLFYSLDLVSYDFLFNSSIKKAQNERRFKKVAISPKKPFSSVMRYTVL